MRVSFEEPTGMWVQRADGEAVPLTFAAFAAAIQDGTVLPDAQVWSRIVTDGQWVRAGDMRLFRMLKSERQAPRPEAADTLTDDTPWPPPIITPRP